MNTLFLGSTVKAWVVAFVVGAATWLVLKFLRQAGLEKLEKLAATTRTAIDDSITGALMATKWWFYALISIFVGAYPLNVTAEVDEILETTATVAVLLQAAIWLIQGLSSWLEAHAQRKAADGEVFRLSGTIMFIFRLVVWAVFALLLLENMGVDVSALIAGFGVGGIAVALAVQNVLGDLFASLSIAIDQPFVPGDFIIVGEHMGTVEETGLKTTRLKSISGEQLIFSNTDLLGARIANYGRMDERRCVFELGVEYATARDQLDAIPQIVADAIEAHDSTRFDRCHFKAFGDSALLFETVYFMKQPDYALYMDTQQAINLSILDAFRERGIGFAYPTRTIFTVPSAG